MFLDICKKLDFPQESLPVLLEAQARIEADPASRQTAENACRCFVTVDGGDPTPLLASVAEATGLPLATVTMVVLLRAVPRLQQQYRDSGVADAILWDTLTDLTCKLRENYQTAGVWGTEVISWYQRLFTMRILKLGRLEYEPLVYRWETPFAGLRLGDPVLNIHIPSCGSLPMEAVMESLRTAHRFFRDRFASDWIPFICASWMLYPPMCEAVFRPGSNLHSFYRCFQTVELYADPSNKHFWRIFGLHYTPEALHTAPSDTTLRRELLAWMRAGNHMGIGRSAFLFDGEKIIQV